MRGRQSKPRQWLITDDRLGRDLVGAVRRLPAGSGVLVRHHHLPARSRRALLRRLRAAGAGRRLTIVDEASGAVARVHDAREIRQARLRGASLLFVSSLFATRSHPERRPLAPMRAAALARLAGRRAIALGGMDARRYARVRALGFSGWAAIDAWLKPRI